uniref:Uncharacterized protein n=1 Tax=Rhizophora mucronata TaxID=61149 RepID=A0A2P2QQF0_RHIMU
MQEIADLRDALTQPGAWMTLTGHCSKLASGHQY